MVLSQAKDILGSFAEFFAGLSFSWKLAWIVFVAQGLLGICLLEWAWKKMERLRLAPDELMEEFPSFRRMDVQLWSRSKFYPGCFLMLIPRTCLIFGCVFFVGFWQRLLFWGQDMSVPLSGWRRTLHKRLLWSVVPLVILAFGYTLQLTDHDTLEVDYSKYLGPKWKSQKFEKTRVSTMVSNHIGFIEILAYICLLTPPSFTPAHYVKNFPIGDHFVRSLQSIYVDRTKNQETRNALVQRLGNRQRLIESDTKHDWGPLLFFAEGSVTNGQNLSRFRRGAFSSGVAVQPIVFKYKYQTVSPEYAVVKGLELGFLMLSEFSLNVFDAHRYPIFLPNDYLYSEYRKTIPNHETLEDWEVYAHAVADLMRREGGFGINEQPLREKVNLQEFLWAKKDQITVNGKTFYWPPRSSSNSSSNSSNNNERGCCSACSSSSAKKNA